MNTTPEPTETSMQPDVVDRRQLKPSKSETFTEIGRFTVRSWRTVHRLAVAVLAVLVVASVALWVVDSAAAWLLYRFRPQPGYGLGVVLASIAAIFLFLRTDPPGGSGGMFGDPDTATWERRRAGRAHLLVTLALLAAVLICAF